MEDRRAVLFIFHFAFLILNFALSCLLPPAFPSEQIDEIEHHDGYDGDYDRECEGFVVAPGLNGVVDCDRSCLRLARNVSGDHYSDAEVAESACEGERGCCQHAARGERQRDAKEDAPPIKPERARRSLHQWVNILKCCAKAFSDKRQRVNRRRNDSRRDGEGQAYAEISVEKAAEVGSRAEQYEQVVAKHCRRKNERQRDQSVNNIASRKTLSRENPCQTRTCHERNQRGCARHSKREFYRKPINLASIHSARPQSEIGMA